MTGKELAALRIIHFPDPRLRKRCKPIEHFDAHLRTLAARMLELMREDRGVGLAAPQVGLPIRLFVCNITGEPKDDLILVNPELTDLEGDVVGEEGCLSIPEVTVDIHRAERCTLRAFGADHSPIHLKGADLAARCWQHECDHLDGKLIIDRMSDADRIANRKQIKKLKSEFKRR